MEAFDIWKQALPGIKDKVTGVGIWAALNATIPVAFEDDVLVVGVAQKDIELAGHLRLPQMHKTMEHEVSQKLGRPVEVRIIDGPSAADWERAKRRDQESRRLQELAANKAKAESAARTNWDGVYEQLGRKYAAVGNKSMPQNRAAFFKECVDMLAEIRKKQGEKDDFSERSFARCIERVAQYCEIPSAIVALQVLQAAGEA